MGIIDKFFNSAIRPSDLKYSWAVVREHPVDYDAVVEEAPPRERIRATRKLAKALADLIEKHTSRRWRYVLYRRSTGVDALIKALSVKSRCEQNEFIATSGNWKVLQKAVRDNETMRRKFSSLAVAQKWADKNGIAVDVYGLYAKSRAEKCE